jgi:hypothetical protein
MSALTTERAPEFKWHEALVEACLQDRGYVIMPSLAHNAAAQWPYVAQEHERVVAPDLLAHKGGRYLFVEVKTKPSGAWRLFDGRDVYGLLDWQWQQYRTAAGLMGTGLAFAFVDERAGLIRLATDTGAPSYESTGGRRYVVYQACDCIQLATLEEAERKAGKLWTTQAARDIRAGHLAQVTGAQ